MALLVLFNLFLGFPRLFSGKESLCQCRRHRRRGSMLGSGRSPRRGNGTHFSILDWKIPWTEGSSKLYPMELQRVEHDLVTKQHLLLWNIHSNTAAAAAKSLQSCPTLCDPIEGSPPGSPVPGILQARTLEWVAISFSSAWKWKVKVKLLSSARPSATPWTAAFQAPPSMGFSRQEYWSGVPLHTTAL